MVGRGRRLAGALFAAAAAATILALAGTAAKVALAAGLPAALLCYGWRARTARVAALLSVVVVISAPLTFARLERVSDLVVTANDVKQSAGHRLLIWSFVGDRIAEHPLAGWGLNSSRAIPGGKDLIRPGESWLPLHPHNAPLQLWLELGVPGAALMALLTAYAWLALARAEVPRLYAGAVAGSLACAFVATLATYGIWEEWWQGTLWFCLFLVLVMARVAWRTSLPAGTLPGGLFPVSILPVRLRQLFAPFDRRRLTLRRSVLVGQDHAAADQRDAGDPRPAERLAPSDMREHGDDGVARRNRRRRPVRPAAFSALAA